MTYKKGSSKSDWKIIAGGCWVKDMDHTVSPRVRKNDTTMMSHLEPINNIWFRMRAPRLATRLVRGKSPSPYFEQ